MLGWKWLLLCEFKTFTMKKTILIGAFSLAFSVGTFAQATATTNQTSMEKEQQATASQQTKLKQQPATKIKAVPQLRKKNTVRAHRIDPQNVKEIKAVQKTEAPKKEGK